MTNAQSTTDLRQYWQIIRARKFAIIIPTLLALGLAAVYVFVLQKPQYTAQARVLVNPIVTPSTTTATAKGNVPNMNTEQAAANSGPVAVLARKSLGLSSTNGERLMSHLTVSASSTANVLQFQYTSPDPQRAARFANAFAQAYITYRNSAALKPLAKAITDRQHTISALMAQLPHSGKIQRGVLVAQLREDATQLAQFQADRQLVSAGTVITNAGVPSSPSSPKVAKTLLIAGVIGLVIGLCLALIREAMDGRIKDPDALESRLRAPVLGVIPKFDARSPERSLATVADPRGAASEAYRMTAITLEHLAARDGQRVIMVVSPQDGGGASTTVANLGVVLAQAGHRVMLVSADLRYPTLHLIFGLPAEPWPGLHPARDAGCSLGVRCGDSCPPDRRHGHHLECRRVRGPGAAESARAARSGGREHPGRDLHVRPEQPEEDQEAASRGRTARGAPRSARNAEGGGQQPERRSSRPRPRPHRSADVRFLPVL